MNPHLARRLEDATYQYAVTMPTACHYYTLRKTWDDAEFNDVLRDMRESEYRKKWDGREYGYVNINGYRYWTMGAKVEATILINRAPLFYPAGECFDRIAGVYDKEYSTNAADIEQSEEYFTRAAPNPVEKILDIGCGTGMLVDFRTRRIEPENYTGIDVSAGMLGTFAAKHPAYRNRLIRTAFEDFLPADDEEFDTITALFGVASYIEPAIFLPKVHELLKPGGRAFLMYHSPKRGNGGCYKRFGIDSKTTPYHAPANEAILRGDIYDILDIEPQLS